MIELFFANETDISVDVNIFRDVAVKLESIIGERIVDVLGSQNGRVGLILVNNEAIRNINHNYRNRDAYTDVISFAYLENEHIPRFSDLEIGDIFISVETAQKQSRENGREFEIEMKTLFVHGFLHLFRFDHQTDLGEAEMEKYAKLALE